LPAYKNDARPRASNLPPRSPPYAPSRSRRAGRSIVPTGFAIGCRRASKRRCGCSGCGKIRVHRLKTPWHNRCGLSRRGPGDHDQTSATRLCVVTRGLSKKKFAPARIGRRSCRRVKRSGHARQTRARCRWVRVDGQDPSPSLYRPVTGDDSDGPRGHERSTRNPPAPRAVVVESVRSVQCGTSDRRR